MSPLPCPRCRLPIPHSAQFCVNCGASAPKAEPTGTLSMPALGAEPAAAPEAPAMAICLGCGVIAPQLRSSCALCDYAFEKPRPGVPISTDQTVWAAVQASFECRACGHRSPINHLDADGNVQCLRCGIDQLFKGGQWWKALDHAHAVADLGGPNPEGVLPHPKVAVADVNPYRAIGKNETFAELGQSSHQQLRLKASPGHPLCDECRSPLSVSSRTPTDLGVTCPKCKSERHYVLPEQVTGHFKRLVGIIAPEHERGRKDVLLQRDVGGATAIKCPNCSAPLEVTGGSTVVTCRFCNVTSRISSSAMHALGLSKAQPLTWWLLFKGFSKERQELVSRVQSAAAKAAQRAEQSRRQAEAASRHNQAELARPKPQPARRPDIAPPRPKKNANRIFLALLPVVSVVGYLAIQFTNQRGADARKAAQQAQEQRQQQMAQAAAAPPAKPPVSFVATWSGKVKSASGASVKQGDDCKVEMKASGASVSFLRVECSGERLYDSRVQVSGMRMMNRNLFESPGDAGGHRYMLQYSDTGQRTGGSQLTLDTAAGQGMAFSDVPPIFKVEFSTEPHSDERTGEAVFDTKLASAVERDLTVSSVKGSAPLKAGDGCQVKITPIAVYAGGAVCHAELTCKKKGYYGHKGAGRTTCRVDEHGVPFAHDDKEFSSASPDPRFLVDLRHAEATLSDDPIAGVWEVQFAVSGAR